LYFKLLLNDIQQTMKQAIFILVYVSLVFFSCGQTGNTAGEDNINVSGFFRGEYKESKNPQLKGGDYLNKEGKTIDTRFNLPDGYERTEADNNSFMMYLRSLPIKPHGSKVMLYNGRPKFNQSVHLAVVDIDVGKYNLQQCADAIMRLRAEYLYQNEQYDKIHFNFTNGFRVDYSKWMEGSRIVVKGNRSYWVQSAEPSNTYDDFRNYMKIIFTYAGSLSLSKELKEVEYNNMEIGDIFIQGGSPGHAVIVVDMAVNSDTGEKIYMLVQSYMPAQEMHVLKNPEHPASPWYNLDINDNIIETPEWTFYSGDLMRFQEE
jgi:hypothetical protein